LARRQQNSIPTRSLENRSLFRAGEDYVSSPAFFFSISLFIKPSDTSSNKSVASTFNALDVFSLLLANVAATVAIYQFVKEERSKKRSRKPASVADEKLE